ncbi:aromatic ring-hydroxylating oxygenase subunit alpha [Rhodococcus pyridinivorans]|uniref:Rieske (2Fe-2S) domain-containing protein n=1 Tax=Rhodococcus pyridinivorans AK37 TaxID=1114960 RepID=H0JKE1_9NOCA|nr:aromatic ring-hydroxylating dioxygenase subunit alpha [Rhodococcus pyridinivorans]EHK86743.1 Rieske (2Fe-2S) domain-containing protein [Rhodococcus pyridinivorans AK37]MCD2143597.1 aromatic ring-hydroxylating dioxygenase subunit alpha [Rhodococcus pyridinivorans]
MDTGAVYLDRKADVLMAHTTEETSLGGLVQQIRQQADLPLEQAVPLPTRTYWDPEFYEHELTHIFRKDWVCIARVEQAPEPGSYVSVDLAGEPLIVVRGEDDEVRVFSRVCRHRYVDILSGKTSDEAKRQGCAERFECPYHAWTYRLDGSLLSAPEMSARPGFDPAGNGLRPIRTEIWQGFVFVNLDDDTTRPFDMSEWEDVQDSYDFTDWRIATVVDWGESTVNWKIVVENYSECYHHIGIHKDTLQPLWPIGTVEVGHESGSEWFFSRMMAGVDAASGEEDGHLLQPSWLPPQPGLSAYQRSQSLLMAKFPIFMLVPSPDITFWFKALPTGPETHTLEVALMVPAQSLGTDGFEEGVKEAADFFRTFQAEDASVNEYVQSSVRSARAANGVLHPHEQPIWQLQKYLASRLPDGSS